MRKNPYGLMHAADLMAVIDDTIFVKEIDKAIAINIYVNSMTIEKCASLIDYSCKTVQKRLPVIEDRINNILSTKKTLI